MFSKSGRAFKDGIRLHPSRFYFFNLTPYLPKLTTEERAISILVPFLVSLDEHVTMLGQVLISCSFIFRLLGGVASSVEVPSQLFDGGKIREGNDDILDRNSVFQKHSVVKIISLIMLSSTSPYK